MDEYVYKFKIFMVIANLTLQGGQPRSTLFIASLWAIVYLTFLVVVKWKVQNT